MKKESKNETQIGEKNKGLMLTYSRIQAHRSLGKLIQSIAKCVTSFMHVLCQGVIYRKFRLSKFLNQNEIGIKKESMYCGKEK